MRLNRIVRNEIESRFGIGAIEEIERYNDGRVDLLDDFGVELPLHEEIAQQAVLASLAAHRSGL